MMKRGIIQAGLIFAVVLSIFWPLSVSAGMRVMANEELEAIDGQAFATFRIEHRIARGGAPAHDVAVVLLDTRLTGQLSFEHLKLGYRNSHAGWGWDQDMRNVRLGTPAEPLVLDGMRIEFAFNNIYDPAIRKLLFVKVGSDRTRGVIQHRDGAGLSGFFEQFSTDIRATCIGINVTMDVNAHRTQSTVFWGLRYWFRDITLFRIGSRLYDPNAYTRFWFATADVSNLTALNPHTANAFPGRGMWMHVGQAGVSF